MEKDGVLRRALGLLNEMRERKLLKPDVLSVTTAMSACAKGVVWRSALGLFDGMRECE